MSSHLDAAAAARRLAPKLAGSAQTLFDPTSEAFKMSMKRFSDVGLQIPAAILLPTTDEDIATIVLVELQQWDDGG